VRCWFFYFYIFLKNLMPMPTTTDNNSILAILQIATKAWAKGGGMGASSGLGGRGGGRGGGVSKPGSRGGKFWVSPSGKVEYGAKPSGARGKTGGGVKPAAKPQAVARHTSTTRVAANRAGAAKPKKPLGKLQQQHRMLSEMDRAIKTGMDPHGNKLSPANIEKLRFLATSLRTDLKGSAKKEVQPEPPFKAYKDINGQWRWLVRSSSAFTDRDGETVSLKALEKATQKLAEKGEYGDLTILDWWHTPITLGKCDFSALHGKVLVESGIFANPVLGEKISTAIANKEFIPGVSLTFAHREPGPAVLPGRIFEEIEIISRSLLPADRASNVATTMEIINLAANPGQTTKEVILKMDAVKEEKLKKLIGPELYTAFINGTEIAEKSLEIAGLSYKAVVPAVAEPPAEVAVPEPAPVVVEPVAPAPVVSEVVAEPEAELETEDAPVEIDAAVMFDGLAQAVADKVLASMASTQATATKEVNDVIAAQTMALKENTGALNKVVAENVALKARLDALEGNLPAGVRARVTQQPGISAKQLAPEHAGIVTAEKNTDPYLAAADRMMQTIPRG
jgi:hypothetical protein